RHDRASAVSHGPAHDLGRCAEDCILTTPAEYRELLQRRVNDRIAYRWMLAASWSLAVLGSVAAWTTDISFWLYLGTIPMVLLGAACWILDRRAAAPVFAAVLAPVRELRGDPQ